MSVEITDAIVDKIARLGVESSIRNRQNDFLDELDIGIEFEKAYLDKADRLPVVVLKITTSKAAANEHGNMHSGSLCTLVDHMSTFCLFADPEWWDFPNGADEPELKSSVLDRIGLEIGLSRNIKVHIQTPIPAGSTIYLATKIMENDTGSIYFFTQIFDTKGHLLASGHHDKVKLTKKVTAKI